jgi:hypothetical protein
MEKLLLNYQFGYFPLQTQTIEYDIYSELLSKK